ncbi:helix-turn-helix domain-containing protein [Paenibacillus sp. NEAU-GSW1]|uniref:helix-turn-helix domain-containing protein n=1 Tax=Paenibacillus sp. NEAU-GSW1 TaxID=2682486 RepID=UPI0012E0F1F9|nr:helix-turn-helix domain-containing protein [Paenibacillus sp. NEAU-GSW1]MUT68675.1 response regulator [Paenibacillus sp. NEAU-GSW1]
MYTLLIVDDEEIAIRGIVNGIDWSDMPFDSIVTAYDSEEAKEIMQQQTIHVVISDIDMPNESGIQLLEWVNEYSPGSVTIFLTGHADFKYAQQAVQLDCYEYLLKPVDHKQLKECVSGAIDKVRENEKIVEIRTTYNHYYEQWNKQRPALIERFWQDVLHYRVSTAPAQLEDAMNTYGIEMKADSHIRAVLISIEQWREDWSARDEEIMTYGVKNAADELIRGAHPGHAVQDANGILFVLFYGANEEQEEFVAEKCRSFIQQCAAMLHCRLSCYVGQPVPVKQLRANAELLLEMEKNNVSASCTVIMERDFIRKSGAALLHELPFADWALLLDSGKRTELSLRIDETFDQMQEAQVEYTYMAAFYYGFMNMLFQWMTKKTIAQTDVFARREWEEGEQAMKSLQRMRAWIHQIVSQLVEYTEKNGKDVSQVVERIRRYMEEHIDEEFSREQAADEVFLNPAYLSRLFRRETGYSLTDYLVRLRISKARTELEKTNTRISDIASMVGYSNFSHFSKLFKKETGFTPQEYRKKVQAI